MKNILESLVEKKTNHKAIYPGLHCPGLHCSGLLCPGMLKGGASKGQENSFILNPLGQNQELSCPELFVTRAKRGSYSHKLA